MVDGGHVTPGARGDVHLQVGDEDVAILFTNRALAEAERVTGKTIVQLMRGAQGDSLGIGDVAALLWIGMEHARRENHVGGRSYTLNDAWRIMDGAGFGTVAGPVFEAVVAVVSWTGEKEGDSAAPLGRTPGTGTTS